MIEMYDDLAWTIGDIPIGSSTPDDMFELDYVAAAQCPRCGGNIEGTAHVWSHDENFISKWLERVDYEPCECNEENEDDFDDDEEETDSGTPKTNQ